MCKVSLFSLLHFCDASEYVYTVGGHIKINILYIVSSSPPPYFFMSLCRVHSNGMQVVHKIDLPCLPLCACYFFETSVDSSNHCHLKQMSNVLVNTTLLPVTNCTVYQYCVCVCMTFHPFWYSVDKFEVLELFVFLFIHERCGDCVCLN